MATQSVKSQSRNSYHRGNVREDLLSAAAEILEAEGVAAVTLRRLTREIGVTPANFYNHFKSLDFLLAAIAGDGFQQLQDRQAEVIKRHPDVRKRFRALCREYIYFAVDHPQLYRIMFGYLTDFSQYPGLKEASNRAFEASVRLVYGDDVTIPEDSLQSFKEFSYAFSSWSMLHGIAQIIIDNQVNFKTGSRKEIGAFVDGATAAFIEGLGNQFDRISG